MNVQRAHDALGRGVLAVFVLGSVSAFAQDAKSARATASVEYFLKNPHGLHRLADEDRARLAELAAAFGDEQAAVVRQAMEWPERASLGVDVDVERLQRHERALDLLGHVGGERARELAKADLEESTGRLRALEKNGLRTAADETAERTLAGLRRRAFVVLGELGDPTLIPSVLDEIDSSDTATQVVMLDYLGKVAVGNASVVARLEAAQRDPQSAIVKNAAGKLAYVLDELKR